MSFGKSIGRAAAIDLEDEGKPLVGLNPDRIIVVPLLKPLPCLEPEPCDESDEDVSVTNTKSGKGREVIPTPKPPAKAWKDVTRVEIPDEAPLSTLPQATAAQQKKTKMFKNQMETRQTDLIDLSQNVKVHSLVRKFTSTYFKKSGLTRKEKEVNNHAIALHDMLNHVFNDLAYSIISEIEKKKDSKKSVETKDSASQTIISGDIVSSKFVFN